MTNVGGDSEYSSGQSGEAMSLNNQLEEEKQRIDWMSLKSSIFDEIKRCNTSNLREVIVNLFKLNLLRGRGILVKYIMRAQFRHKNLTSVYAALVSVLNSKIPDIGELLLSRLILLYRKSYVGGSRKCLLSSLFITQLVNQKVCSDIVLLQILQTLLDEVTVDSLEIASEVFVLSGKHLEKSSPQALKLIVDKFRRILHESKNQKIQRIMIRVFAIQKDEFRDHPSIAPELDLVEDEDQKIHVIELNDDLKSKDYLNCFHIDKDFERHESEYDEIRKDILGDDSLEESEGEQSDNDVETSANTADRYLSNIKDMTESNLLEYQKKVYFTIMSSISADEATHKLLKLNLGKSGTERERSDEVLVDMMIKCCSQEKTYSKYYGIIGEKLCSRNKKWHHIFVNTFKSYYNSIHQFESNALRNIGKFFGHLFLQDVLAIEDTWCEIHLTEEDTNPASRVFIKFIFQEMVEEIGIASLMQMLSDPVVRRSVNGLLPREGLTKESADHLRFSINFFTAIGLGVLTEEMRSSLNNLPLDDEIIGSPQSPSNYSDRSYSRSPSASP